MARRGHRTPRCRRRKHAESVQLRWCPDLAWVHPSAGSLAFKHDEIGYLGPGNPTIPDVAALVSAWNNVPDALSDARRDSRSQVFSKNFDFRFVNENCC